MKTDIFTDSYRYNPDFHRFADYLGIDRDDRNDIKVAKKMALLYDWACMDTGKNDMESAVSRVDALRKESGVTFMGKDLTNFLYGRVRVHMDRVQEAARELEGRIKTEEAKRELMSERKKGKDWIRDQEDMKNRLSESTKITTKELNNYYKVAKKDIPTFENKMKAQDMPNTNPKPELV